MISCMPSFGTAQLCRYLCTVLICYCLFVWALAMFSLTTPQEGYVVRYFTTQHIIEIIGECMEPSVKIDNNSAKQYKILVINNYVIHTYKLQLRISQTSI